MPEKARDEESVMGDRFTTKLLSLTFVFAGGVLAQSAPPPKDIPAIAGTRNGTTKAQTQGSNPTVKETLRWMQSSLQSGSGDYWVGHETHSVRVPLPQFT